MIKYLAFDIGCIECSEDSQPLGVFNTEKEAIEACDIAKAQMDDYGQHVFKTYKLEIPE